MSGLSRVSLEHRRKDYSSALSKWVDSGNFSKIVYCDNSGLSEAEVRDCISIADVDGKGVEIEVLCYGDIPNPDFHYGYSELGLIDHALKNSKLLKDAKYFTKCTGRLFFPEYMELSNLLLPGCRFYVDSRCDFLWHKAHVTTQLMIFDILFYKAEFQEKRSEMLVEEYYIENYFLRKLIPYKNISDVIFRWPIEMLPDGYAAHTGKRYDSNVKRIISFFRGKLRVLIPGFWF
jgi:hypothetical protein